MANRDGSPVRTTAVRSCRSAQVVRLALAGALLAGLSATAAAQQRGTPTGAPTLVDVGNDAQNAVSLALHAVCDQFRSATNQGVDQENPFDETLPPEQQALYQSCLQMEHTANLRFSNGHSTQFAIFEIQSIDELATTLQQFGTEELAAEGTRSSQVSQGNVLENRLAALRRGATGISVSGLDMRVAGHRVDLARLLHHVESRPGASAGRHGAIGASRSENRSEPSGVFRMAPAAEAVEGGAAASERWGAFVNGTFSFGDKDATSREDGFDFEVPGIAAGVDHRFNPRFVLGGAVSHESFKGDFDTTPAVAGGNMKSKVSTLSAYTSYYTDRLYVDGTLAYGWNDYDLTRNVLIPTVSNQAIAGETSGTQYEATAAVGFLGHRGAFQYTPLVRVSRVHTSVDGYVESLAAAPFTLVVDAQEIESLVAVVGSQFSWTLSGTRIFVPQARVEWHHEFEDDSRLLVARFVDAIGNAPINVPSDEPDQDYAALGLGFSTVGKGGLQAFFEAEALLGLANLTNYTAAAGIRFTF